MQTFLPYTSFLASLKCLDSKRLGKQRIEALQILNALHQDSTSRWRNHPAVKMWKGYEPALEAYKNIAIQVWKHRGFNNTMVRTFNYRNKDDDWEYPHWLTFEFCFAHRSNLLRKDPIYYGQFNWNVPHDLPYIWPKGKEE